MTGEADADEDWRALMQVVQVEPHQFRAADLELAVVMRTNGGDFTLRVVSLDGSDLEGALPYLLDADPEGLRHRGRDRPIRVTDEAFDLADGAFAAAYDRFPLADPEDWMDDNEFRSLVVDDPALRPWAFRAGDFGPVVGVVAGMAVFAGVLFGVGFPLNVRLGLNTPERQDTLPDHVFAVVTFAVACLLSVLAYRLVVRLLDRP